MVAGLLEEVEKVFTRDVLEEEEKIRLGLECAIKRDNIWVSGQCLMDSGLRVGERRDG